MDAQRNEAVTPSHNEPNLDVLAEQWLQQKTLEDNCKARRIEIEAADDPSSCSASRRFADNRNHIRSKDQANHQEQLQA